MNRGWVSEIFSSFQGEGLFAGRRHVFLRLAGCNLRCRYCDTPDSLERTPTCMVHEAGGHERQLENPLPSGEVAELLAGFLSAPGVHALALTGGEPLLQADFLVELLGAAPPRVPVLLETNGTYPERLEEVLPFVDIISMDVKLGSNSGEGDLWEAHRRFLERSQGKTLYVKVPVDEGTEESEVRRAARLVAAVDSSRTLFLQPILAPDARLQISGERLERFYDVAVEHVPDVRVLPQAHRFLGVR